MKAFLTFVFLVWIGIPTFFVVLGLWTWLAPIIALHLR